MKLLADGLVTSVGMGKTQYNASCNLLFQKLIYPKYAHKYFPLIKKYVVFFRVNLKFPHHTYTHADAYTHIHQDNMRDSQTA